MESCYKYQCVMLKKCCHQSHNLRITTETIGAKNICTETNSWTVCSMHYLEPIFFCLSEKNAKVNSISVRKFLSFLADILSKNGNAFL